LGQILSLLTNISLFQPSTPKQGESLGDMLRFMSDTNLDDHTIIIRGMPACASMLEHYDPRFKTLPPFAEYLNDANGPEAGLKRWAEAIEQSGIPNPYPVPQINRPKR
jgi:hypothetical protein